MFSIRAFLSVLLLILPLFAAGGPPMMTDGPETSGDQKLEINIASKGDLRGNVQRYEFPIIDIAYGVGNNIQLKIESAYVSLFDDGNKHTKGVGNTKIGMKWRFYENNSNDLLVSTYPQYAFTPVKKSLYNGVAEMDQAFFLPIEISKKLGVLNVTGEFGYLSIKDSRDEIQYGIVVGYDVLENLEILAELHNSSYVNGGNTTMITNGGFTYKISPKYSFMFSAGRELISPEALKSTLFYMGLELHY